MIYEKDYKPCLHYIRNYWKRITFYHPTDKQLHLSLPNKYVSPNRYIFKKDFFYWDSYFILLALVRSNQTKLAKGIVENFAHLFKRFGIMPMRNRYYNLGTSQIPFFTSMCLEIYSIEKNLSWLKRMADIAEKELHNYWMNKSLTEKHIVHKKLSRYCDHYITHLGAEHESGWDMTSRFSNRCLDYLPVDLNTCLYKYETDLTEIFLLSKNYYKAKLYKRKALNRKRQIIKLMWNDKKKFFFDYIYTRKVQSNFLSVAGFYPLWAKLASQHQAERIREFILPLFEYEGGIVNTQRFDLSEDTKQHDFPNGWPNQQWIVIKGLMNYGFYEDAIRIARKWLDMNNKLFHETGKFWEKHDVVNCKVGVFNPERYPTQSGFAWTNAVFVSLIKELNKNNARTKNK